jgi:uncharacterized membrane protein
MTQSRLFRPVRGILPARPRLYASLVIGAAAFAALPRALDPAMRILIGWNVAVALYLALAFVMMARSTPASTRLRAVRQQDGRWTVLGLMAAAASASLIAIGIMLSGIKDRPPDVVVFHVLLAGITIISSWVFVNTLFAQIYAHEFFGPHYGSSDEDALAFPDEPAPDYWDFLYFAAVIGMTCQVSDVAIRSRLVRRVALAHGVLSFFFNTGILALSVNIGASLL